ncbi:MAG: hypothetical protein ACRDJL_11690 [Actinomycetota bacterium]
MSIEDRLRTQLEHAATTIPVVTLDLEETLTKGRRARRVAFARAAGAAAIVLGLGFAGATSWLNGEAPRPIPPVDQSPSPAPSPTTAPRPTEQEVESVLRSWLQAIQDGDEDAVWELMTEGARAELGREQFDQLMASALPEGMGAFADPEVEVDLIALDQSEGDPGIVATVTGTVQREGAIEFAAEPIPLRIEGGRPLVDEIFDDRYEVNTVWTSSGLGPQPLRAGEELPIEEVSPDIERVYLSIDGASPATMAELDPGGGTASVALDRSFEAGRHVATIVLVDGDGRMFPVTRVFESAAP